MPADFKIVIDRVLTNEGELSLDPNDSGNYTGGKVGVGELKGSKFGISAASYPDLDIKNLTRDDAIAIYKRDFWDKLDGVDMPLALAFQAMDFAVNSGCGTAIRYLQQAAGVADDGHVGDVTIKALNAMPDEVLTTVYIALRLKYLRKCKGWPTQGGGWVERIANNMLYAAEDFLLTPNS